MDTNKRKLLDFPTQQEVDNTLANMRRQNSRDADVLEARWHDTQLGYTEFPIMRVNLIIFTDATTRSRNQILSDLGISVAEYKAAQHHLHGSMP